MNRRNEESLGFITERSPNDNHNNGIFEKKDNQVVKEVKKQLWLAGPLICANFLQFCLQLISLMFVGHLDELSLSAASMASSFASVTGFSLILGMASALDTLSGQSYGAKRYRMLGIQMQRAMIVELIVSVPLAVICFDTANILKFLGQDPIISEEAGDFARFLIPSIFALGLVQCEVKFLQTQNNVVPMMITSVIVTLFHILACWLLVFKSGLGGKGAALANGLSDWINFVLLGIYIKFSPSCKDTWTGFSKEALNEIPQFLKLAIPSAIMICLETWSFELMVLLAGLLPNPKLETSVLSICLNTAATVWMIPYGLSNAVSTRVSNELGGGRPQLARLAISVVMVMAIGVGITIGIVLLSIRNVWGRAYSNEKEVVKYVAKMMPLLAISNFADGLQCVLSGAVRGCGRQVMGALVNLGSYYLVGIPVAAILAFGLGFGGMGLWLGIICALAVQVGFLSLITVRTNWEKESMDAIDRACDSIPL